MLSKEEVDRLIEEAKEQGIKMRFTGYYKYTFYFTWEYKNYIFRISIGGDSDDIYRLSVERETEINTEGLVSICVYEKKKVYERYAW